MNEKVYRDTDKVEALARGSKLKRFLHAPWKYCLAMLESKIVYRIGGKEIPALTHTAWGDRFSVRLPAGTDIYLTGGKTHDSEIRLARFLARQLHNGDSFLDIGAHFGYYSLLAKECVGIEGKVIAVEPSPSSFQLLTRNTSPFTNILALNEVAGAENGLAEFYEFPLGFSEYNTLYPQQYQNKAWFNRAGFRKLSLKSATVDNLCTRFAFRPDIIKIDTEGAEFEVAKGMACLLAAKSPRYVVMEFLSSARDNSSHKKAAGFIRSYGYQAAIINGQGQLEPCADMAAYVDRSGLESDHVVLARDQI